MKLYVITANNKKVYLNLAASTRTELQNLIGGTHFYLGNTYYSIDNVYAEKSSNDTAAGAVVGGALGALGGPIGILVGTALGGLIGNSSDEEENIKVEKFNASR